MPNEKMSDKLVIVDMFLLILFCADMTNWSIYLPFYWENAILNDYIQRDTWRLLGTDLSVFISISRPPSVRCF